MMRKVRYRTVAASFLTIFISILFITDVFAIETQFTEMKKIEQANIMVVPQVITRPKVEYSAEGLRDPFQSPFKETAAPIEFNLPETPEITEKPLPSLTIQGVIWGGSLLQAIINDKVVKVGDTIEGARVIGIDKLGITLLFEGRKYELPSPALTNMLEKKSQGGQDEKNF